MISVETWPTGVFDVFECGEVFVANPCNVCTDDGIHLCNYLLRKYMPVYDLLENGTIWDDLMAVCLARIKSNSLILFEVRGLTS